jgi:hypothetical protein
MKKLAILALVGGLSLAASAIPIEIPGTGQDIPKNGTGPGGGNGNSPADDFFRLQSVINSFNLANPGHTLPTPVLAGDLVGNGNADQFAGGGLSGFEYAVVHYGAGNGGTQGSGGGVEVFFLNGASSFTFPSNGTGQNGFGGFSSIVLFDSGPVTHSVPDGGTTVLLLGAALSGLALLRRRLS